MHTRDVAVRVMRVGQHTLPLPAYETDGAAGMDLRANLKDKGPSLWLNRGGTFRLPCGFAFAIPEGHEGQVRGRSSMAARGLSVALGTIDSDYRGEIMLVVHNHSGHDVEIEHAQRIAQLIIAPVTRAVLVEVGALSDTARGANGFGSTGAQ